MSVTAGTAEIRLGGIERAIAGIDQGAAQGSGARRLLLRRFWLGACGFWGRGGAR
jgi:hypothetical protein